MAATVTFDEAISYAFQRLSCPTLKLKPEQRSAIEYIFNGSDVFVWLPTGFGKSICYQVLPYLFDAKFDKQTPSAVLIVSPLLSLMVDQVRTLREQGARAAILTSESSVPDAGLIASSADLSLATHLFSSPEALVGYKWRDAVEKIRDRVVAVAIDEAHCVSKW